MSDFFDTKLEKPTWAPSMRKVLTRDLILESQKHTKSNMEAARWLGVSFNTYKKWAKRFDIFDQHLNQEGKGIKKGFGVRNGGHSISKKATGYEKRWNEEGNPNYGSSVYILGLEGEKLNEFKIKFGKEFYKIGKANDIPKRVRDLLGGRKDLGIPWQDDEMWEYWGKNAKVLTCVPTRTQTEAFEIEKAFHYRLRETKVEGILSTEMFETSKEKIDELIQIEVVNYRSQFLLELGIIQDELDNSFDVDKLMVEWTYRVPNGKPDMKNKIHLNILFKILREIDIDETIIKRIHENITS